MIIKKLLATEKQKEYEAPQIYLDSKAIDLKSILDLPVMASSDSKVYTTWSNIRHTSVDQTEMSRHPSGNNNTIPNLFQATGNVALFENRRRSSSLPDLRRGRRGLEYVDALLNISVSYFFKFFVIEGCFITRYVVVIIVITVKRRIRTRKGKDEVKCERNRCLFNQSPFFPFFVTAVILRL